MRNLKLELFLEFSEKITSDDDIQEIAQKVVNALVNEANTGGIAPDNSDAFTTTISVYEPFSITVVEHKF